MGAIGRLVRHFDVQNMSDYLAIVETVANLNQLAALNATLSDVDRLIRHS